MTPTEIKLYELRKLRDKLNKSPYVDDPQLLAIREEIQLLRDYIAAENPSGAYECDIYRAIDKSVDDVNLLFKNEELQKKY